ncbi:MAG: hypothetical protein AAB738_01620 [Patescibacteria group bacterium]
MSNFEDEKLWRSVTNFWTVIFLVFIVVNFATANRYEYLVGPFAALYIGVLTLYIGTKEFDRWHETHVDRHPGEVFVFAWSLIIFGTLVASLFLGSAYRIPSEIIASYIAVLSIFALTQKSKHVFEEKEKKENKKTKTK